MSRGGRVKRVIARYGGSPAELLLTIACLLIAGAAVVGWTQRPGDLAGVLIWFAGAAVLHDLVFLPLYSLLDRATIARLPPRVAGHTRAPLIVCGLVGLACLPTILGFGASSFHYASGLTEHGYLARWLIFSGVVCLLSVIAFHVRGGGRGRAGGREQA